MNSRIILITILILGLLLRIITLETSPPSLYGDELTIALDTHSLFKTGHDQLGNLLPLTFPMGAGRPAGYVYGSIPFIALFGPSALGVRALSIFSGLGLIILLYYVCRKLLSEKVGLAASFIAAVSPWDISLSRGGFEAHFALFLALLGFYLFIKAKEKPMFYIISAISFGLTLHTYPTYKVSLAFFLPLLFWFQESRRILDVSKKYFLAGVIILLILGFLSISQTFIGGSETRFSDINIFSQATLKNTIEQKINLERNITDSPKTLSRYFYNKPVEYTKILIENYLRNFSLDFLILHGDRNPRHNMATMGEIYFAELILIIFGILTLWQKNKKVFIFLTFWLVLSPLPTAIVDLPHALRSSFMLPPLIILSSLGLVAILNMKNRMILTTVAVVFIIQFIFFIQKLYFLAPNEYGSFWSYPAKLASEIAIQNKEKYDYIILSDRIDSIEFAYPVYAKVDPTKVISQNKKKTQVANLTFKKFDNTYIGSIPDGNIQRFLNSLDGSYLYIDVPSISKNLDNYETMVGTDGLTALIFKRFPSE